MVLRKSPELNKRSHKLALVTLRANMCQADNKIILKKILNNNISIDSGQIEINRQLVNHFQLIVLNEIPEYALDLSLRNVFDPTMLDEFL